VPLHHLLIGQLTSGKRGKEELTSLLFPIFVYEVMVLFLGWFVEV